MIQYHKGSSHDTFENMRQVQNEVIKIVEPKQGRAVIFDGRIYHSSSSPVQSQKRIVINFNFNTIVDTNV